jgi:hypothetical protein
MVRVFFPLGVTVSFVLTAKTVDQLLQLPMTGLEEEKLVQFLTDSGDQYCQEVLILHYLQRACYVEAIQLNEKLKQTVRVNCQKNFYFICKRDCF